MVFIVTEIYKIFFVACKFQQEPKCPPHVTGLVAHPSDCTKFLQCANGGTHIMDCGPGTVFNPAVMVCDWPRNVKGCEGNKIFKIIKIIRVIMR